MTQNAEQRRVNARIGAFSLHAAHDSKEITKPAREAFLDRFERQVDPRGVLHPEERRRRAKAARSAYFVRLGKKSGQARRRAR